MKKVWDVFKDPENILEAKLEGVFQEFFRMFEEKEAWLNGSISDLIPSLMQDALATQNIIVNPQFAYMILTKTGENYRLMVYPSKLDVSFQSCISEGSQSPLIYRNVEGAKLNKDFFYCLWGYQSFLKQKGVVSYTLHFEGTRVTRSLKIDPEGAVNCVKRNFSDQSLTALEWTICKEHIIRTCGITEREFDLDIEKKAFEYKYNHFKKALVLLSSKSK